MSQASTHLSAMDRRFHKDLVHSDTCPSDKIGTKVTESICSDGGCSADLWRRRVICATSIAEQRRITILKDSEILYLHGVELVRKMPYV
jgi:hypothetical protein